MAFYQKANFPWEPNSVGHIIIFPFHIFSINNSDGQLFYTSDRHVLIRQHAHPKKKKKHRSSTRRSDWTTSANCLPSPLPSHFFPLVFSFSFSAKPQSRLFALFGAPIRTAFQEAVNRNVPPKVLAPLMRKLQISQVLLSEAWKMKRRSLEPWN